MDADLSKRSLIATLQLAYSGERAAGHAYNGPWRSGPTAGERSGR